MKNNATINILRNTLLFLNQLESEEEYFLSLFSSNFTLFNLIKMYVLSLHGLKGPFQKQ